MKYQLLSCLLLISVISIAPGCNNAPADDEKEKSAPAGSSLNDTSLNRRTAKATAIPRAPAIGDTAFCGIVFYVKDSILRFGDTIRPVSRQILVCSEKDEATRIGWNNGAFTFTGATNDVLFSKFNADRIIAKLGLGGSDYAAKKCRLITTVPVTCDSAAWYLPSKVELKIMFDSLASKGKGSFAKEGYWSSVEQNAGSSGRATEKKAWIVDFLNGRNILNIKSNKYHVRAIKAVTIRL